MTTVAMVAQPTPPPGPDDPGGRGEDFGKSSPVGLLVLLVFLVAVVFLARSMTKHLKRVPASFDPPEEETETPAEERPADPKPEARNGAE
ncbi:hypothetical protein [Actinocrispum wychmicini]|uniref:Preprotein translocase subunit SecG n=1 Tax=Actinocrispum wychmicini TaxID=1213861 RepID=A0A4R2JFI6_9PSEU|nr:hypothetical protein [Actinocrispum wychmicini]TCO58503.1 hypothetical protein EV192_105573 [Actinocrispum wychmicini]